MPNLFANYILILVLLFSCQPPPVYDAIHYARPGLRSALTTYISRLNEMVRSNYSTVTEVTTVTTTSEVVTRRANQENITQAQMIYSYCEFQPRNHPTFTTVYQSPRMTTAMTGPDPTDEEISQRFNWQEPISSDDEIQWQRNRYRSHLGEFLISASRLAYISLRRADTRDLGIKIYYIIGFNIDWYFTYMHMRPAISRSLAIIST